MMLGMGEHTRKNLWGYEGVLAAFGGDQVTEKILSLWFEQSKTTIKTMQFLLWYYYNCCLDLRYIAVDLLLFYLFSYFCSVLNIKI